MQFVKHPSLYTIDVPELSLLHQRCNVNIVLAILEKLHQTYFGDAMLKQKWIFLHKLIVV